MSLRSFFFNWSVVFPILSARSFFPTGQRFLTPNHVTSGSGDVTSGSGHMTSGHVTFGSHQNEATSKRGHNIKTRPILLCEPDLLLRRWDHFRICDDCGLKFICPMFNVIDFVVSLRSTNLWSRDYYF